MILSVMIKSLSHALNLSFKSLSTLTASRVLPHAPAICTSMCMATVRLATPGELKSFSCLFGDPVGMIRITPPPPSAPPCIPYPEPDDTTSCISNNTNEVLRKYRSLTDSGICLTPSDSQSLSSSVDTLGGFEYLSPLDISRASSASPTSDLDRLSLKDHYLSDSSPLRISTPNNSFVYKKDEFKKDLENKSDKPMLPVKVSGPPHFYKFQNILPGQILHKSQFPSFWQDGVFLSWPPYDTLTDSTPCTSDTSRSQSEERDCITSVDSNTLEWDAQSLQRRMRELPSCMCNSPTKLDITGLETVLEDDDIPPQDVMKAVNDWELGYPHGEILTEVSELESSDDCFTLDSYSLPDTDMESIAGSEMTPNCLAEQLEPDDNSIGKVEKIESKADNITLSNIISESVEDCKTASALEINKENVEVGHEHEKEFKVSDKIKEHKQPVCQEPELIESDIDISVLFSDTFDKAYKRSLHKENKEKKRGGKKRKLDETENGEKEAGGQGDTSKERPNYFVAVQVTEAKIHEGLNIVQEHVEEEKPVLSSAMIPLPTLHLTLLVMNLPDQDHIQKACQALDETRRQLVNRQLCGSVTLDVNGLGHFRHNVVFAKLDEGASVNRLKAISEVASECFAAENLLSGNDRGFKPHVTVMKLSRAPKLRKKGVTKIMPSLYSEYADSRFGRQTVTELQLCSMTKPKNKDGYYHVDHTVSLVPDITFSDMSDSPVSVASRKIVTSAINRALEQLNNEQFDISNSGICNSSICNSSILGYNSSYNSGTMDNSEIIADTVGIPNESRIEEVKEEPRATAEEAENAKQSVKKRDVESGAVEESERVDRVEEEKKVFVVKLDKALQWQYCQGPPPEGSAVESQKVPDNLVGIKQEPKSSATPQKCQEYSPKSASVRSRSSVQMGAVAKKRVPTGQRILGEKDAKRPRTGIKKVH